ncbi:hypothetical protein ACNUDN_07580 [Mycobacterium sp. smrl_JER01]|uniref:hypothetical protein n=1 Tax=Mycobacterium sp. smrl_JER01 TaxID=3402633 RepID=UPI003ACE8CD8
MTDALRIGDWLMLWSSDVDNEERPGEYLSGEGAIVAGIASKRIELDRPLRFAHTGAAERRIFRFGMVIEPSVEGGRFKLHNKGNRQVAVTLRYGVGPSVSDIHVSGKSGRYGIHIDQCVDSTVSRASAEDIYDAANGQAPNGVGLYLNGVVGATVNGVLGVRCRHAVDINSFSSRTHPGLVSRDVVVNGVRAIGTYGPGWTTHHVRRVVFNEPASIDCGGGGQLRGYDSTVIRPWVEGGNDTKPPEWNARRYVPSGIAFGETNSLPPGEGFAAEKVYVRSPRFKRLPKGWREVSFSDNAGDVVIDS